MERGDEQSTNHGTFDGGDEPPAFIERIPEVVKLIVASFFVAIVLHNNFFKGKKQPGNNASVIRGDDAGYILGSGDGSLEEEVDGKSDESIIISESSPETTCLEAKAKKKKKRRFNQPPKRHR